MQFFIIVGGLIGLAVNGWRGAAFGALLVWALLPLVGRLLLRTAVRKIGQVQTQFLDSTFAVMGAVCKADGQVSSEEIRVAEALFDQLRLNPEAREAAKRAFNRGKEADFDLDAEVARFATASARAPVFRQLFLQVQVSAIAADGQTHPAEHAMLLRIARGLGMSAHDVAMFEAMMRGGGPGSGGGGGGFGRDRESPSALDDAYQVLGVPATANDGEVKRAYRKLMSENHPDKLAAKGLPESMRALAEEKTRRITAAYERIERARGGVKS
ncbi:co-chaperone DjlA [uncultured Nevskia sp.]|uniref:co-chaperone DjlA n=1 Tax=uncultured Nevskia sp. TaxID=228950 RepID=UPI0025E5BD03|nr:co-chaperone DjlA [uncultured Nevskia sp.]